MTMEQEKLIGPTQGLEEGGKGFRFDVRNAAGETIPAFVVHFDYQYFAYLNKCGHIAIQLDYMPGEFFSDDGQSLICSTHGAEYAPDTGACLGGPCYGVGLEALKIIEDQGQLYLQNDEYQIVSK
ncbi:MAG: nitrite reductase/ring-hydroxylating ferredoxin subunit [Arenicella sp.]|jgi:nitrite reductase/ring-hydroxylating ferredoxin subunit